MVRGGERGAVRLVWAFSRVPVNPSLRQLLAAFDVLPEADQHRAFVEILRRVSPATQADLPESALVEAADELFRALDAEETGGPQD
jgi:hypothetical protein